MLTIPTSRTAHAGAPSADPSSHNLVCKACRYALVGIDSIDARVTCPECGHVNVSNDLARNLPEKKQSRADLVLITSPLWLSVLAIASVWASQSDELFFWLLLLAGMSTIAGPLAYLVYAAIRPTFTPESHRRPLKVALAWFGCGLLTFGTLYALVQSLL